MIKYTKLFLELLVFIYLCYISSGVSILPSETIDAIEGGEYMFELKDDNETNFCNCDYKSNLDVTWTTFPINKPYNACLEVTTTTVASVTYLKKPRNSEKNKVEDFGKLGVCRVYVKNVDDQGPSEWWLKPDDWNNTYNEEVAFKVNFIYTVPLLNKEINIFEGEDFFQYINSSLTFESCSFTFNGTTKPLKLNVEEAVMFNTDSKIDQREPGKIYSLGRGLCGFRLNNAINLSPTGIHEWTLTGVTNDKKKYRAVFLLKIYSKIPDSILHQEIVIQIGADYSVNCKLESNSMETINYCKLYNPHENLVFTLDKISNGDCSFDLKPFQVDNYGVWKCVTGNTKTMKSIERTFKFVEEESPYMSTWAKEKKDYLSIGCQFHTSKITESFDYCKMTSPDQQYFSLTPGGATGRYIALGTDLKNLICEMQIKMPLQVNEIGMWRCETNLGGAFINVSSSAVADYQKYSKLTTRLGRKLLILCQVPYYSNFCYIKSPNGTRYISEKEEAWLGRCALEIGKVDAHDNGTWTCSFAQANGMPDDEISVEVTIADVLTYDPDVKAIEDYPVTMLCNTGGLPLQYCQFIDPNGKSYFIDNKANSSYLSYQGKGIEYGECGIKIANVGKSDNGIWSCVIRLSNKDNEISARISVEVAPNLLSGSNIVLALGLTVGIVAITSLFTIIGISTIRKRRRDRLEIARRQSLHDSTHNDDQDDIFSLGVPPRSFDNPQIVRDDDHQHQY